LSYGNFLNRLRPVTSQLQSNVVVGQYELAAGVRLKNNAYFRFSLLQMAISLNFYDGI